MKKLLAIIMAVIVMLPVIALANQEITGYVTSNQLSVRAEPKESAKKITTLKNGDELGVLGVLSDSQGNQWYQIRLSSIALNDYDENGNERYGYVRAVFVNLSNKRYLTLSQDTVLWAGPGSSVGVRERSKGAKLLILDEYIDAYGQMWYIVQANDGYGGVGFLPSGSYQYNNNPSPSGTTVGANVTVGKNAVVICDTLAVRGIQDDNAEPIGYIHRKDVVSVVEANEYFTGIAYEYRGTTVIGYVHTWYLMGIIE